MLRYINGYASRAFLFCDATLLIARLVKFYSTKRVLLVDDNVDDRTYVREALAEITNFSLTEAQSAIDALTLVRHQIFDCVLLDYHMPDEDGMTVVKSLCPGGVATTPIVMLTGQGDEALVVRALQAGASDYFSKNTAKPDDIARSIERACERFEMASSIRRQHEQTARALHVRDEMMSVLSHELRTPTSVLLLNLQRALRKIEGEEICKPLAQLLGRAIDAVGRINRLTERLLDVSRINQAALPLRLRLTSATQLVRDAVSRFGDYAAVEGCSLSVQAQNEIWVEGDEDRLDQVMTNLLSNAVKYGQRRPVQVSLRKKDGHCVVEICDEGVGVAEKDHERIFQRFERATAIG